MKGLDQRLTMYGSLLPTVGGTVEETPLVTVGSPELDDPSLLQYYALVSCVSAS